MAYYPLTRRYRKYAYGSTMGERDLGMGLSTAGQGLAVGAANAIAPGSGALVAAAGNIGGSLIDAIDKPDRFGHQSNLAAYLKGNLKGGPIGAAGALISNIASKGAEATYMDELARSTHNQQATEGRSRITADPTLLHGNLAASYYAAGGPLTAADNLSNQPTRGGSVIPLSSEDSEFTGPSHEQGGIDLPAEGAQVEGGETAAGDYIFSRRLGFAQAHKPIARAIGKIEQKPASPERTASLKLLHTREQQLKLSQEYLKHTLGLN